MQSLHSSGPGSLAACRPAHRSCTAVLPLLQVRAGVATVLGGAEVAASMPLMAAGLDSLGAVELRKELSRWAGETDECGVARMLKQRRRILCCWLPAAAACCPIRPLSACHAAASLAPSCRPLLCLTTPQSKTSARCWQRMCTARWALSQQLQRQQQPHQMRTAAAAQTARAARALPQRMRAAALRQPRVQPTGGSWCCTAPAPTTSSSSPTPSRCWRCPARWRR